MRSSRRRAKQTLWSVGIGKRTQKFGARDGRRGAVIVKSLNYFSLHREKQSYNRHPENSRNFRRTRSVERSLPRRLSKQAQDNRYLEGNKSFVVAFGMNNRREIPLRQAQRFDESQESIPFFSHSHCVGGGPLLVRYI